VVVAVRLAVDAAEDDTRVEVADACRHWLK
jgi:hypothetical protein